MSGICPGNQVFGVSEKLFFLSAEKIIKVEWDLNTALGSVCLQIYNESFRIFVLLLDFYRHSFTISLSSDITLRKLVFIEIKFRDIWSFLRKPVPVKAIGKLSIGKN